MITAVIRLIETSTLAANPYESPRVNSQPKVIHKTHWYFSYVAPLSKIAFWFGVALAVLGSLITFLPGGETGWFALSAIFVACGLFAPNNTYRIIAILLLIYCVYIAFSGYHRGIEYQEWLKTRPQLSE